MEYSTSSAIAGFKIRNTVKEKSRCGRGDESRYSTVCRWTSLDPFHDPLCHLLWQDVILASPFSQLTLPRFNRSFSIYRSDWTGIRPRRRVYPKTRRPQSITSTNSCLQPPPLPEHAPLCGTTYSRATLTHGSMQVDHSGLVVAAALARVVVFHLSARVVVRHERVQPPPYHP